MCDQQQQRPDFDRFIISVFASGEMTFQYSAGCRGTCAGDDEAVFSILLSRSGMMPHTLSKLLFAPL